MSDSNTTKKLLADALRQLVAEQPFSSVTVGDICSRCAMNRKSFYYHFRDKYDLVSWIFYTDFFDTFLQVKENEEAPDVLRSLCRFLEEDRAFYRAVLRVEGQNSLQEYLSDVLRPVLEERLEPRFGMDPDRSFYVDLYVGLWQSTICEWVLGGCRMPADHLVRLMYSASASLGEAVRP